MSIAELKILQQNPTLAELTLTAGYYSNLQGKIVIRKEDVKRLGLEEHTEIAIGISGKEMSAKEVEPPPASLLSATVTELSIRKGRNTSTMSNAPEYIDYLNIGIRFREIDAVGNLLMVKEHSKGMELTTGDTVFLKVQRVISQP